MSRSSRRSYPWRWGPDLYPSVVYLPTATTSELLETFGPWPLPTRKPVGVAVRAKWLSYLDDDGASEVIRDGVRTHFEAGRTQAQVAARLDRDWSGLPLRPRFE
jgi:hypothetical protein